MGVMTSNDALGLFRAYRTTSSMSKVHLEKFLVQVPLCARCHDDEDEDVVVVDDDDDDDDDDLLFNKYNKNFLINSSPNINLEFN